MGLKFLFGCSCLLCFAAYMNSLQAWVVVCCVVSTVGIVYMSYYWREDSVPCRGKSVVITGCDTGFGHLLAKHLSAQGVTVFAGCLNSGGEGAEALRREGRDYLHVIQMDVTSDKQVEECLKYVQNISKLSGVWGVVNNAGLGLVGDIELTTMAQFRKVTEINMLGIVRVTKAFLPLVRQQHGKIVNVTSVRGRLAMPFTAAYAMSKFAGEAFSDILRMEALKFGVNVCIIEPSNFGGATACLNMVRLRADFEEMWNDLTTDQQNFYGRAYIEQHMKSLDNAIPTACFDIMRVVRVMQRALFDAKPKSRYTIPGGNNWYDMFMVRYHLVPFLPTFLFDRWLLSDVADFKLAKQRS